ncbi:MAG: helix-turn-helix domain-containing protein, partial [Oscillospiraceae bacterium]|nr:helix-turn-helix domain-containing protein [Oscillospiraceae bacterium]
SVTEAAAALGISRRSMYDLIHREDFPTLRVGGRRLISKELLAEWVKNQAQKEPEND